LNDPNQEMQLELDEDDDKYKLYSEQLLLERTAINPYDVISKLVEFASEREIDFILWMDQDFLLSNNAFDESKIKENMTEKMQEFSHYKKSILIIDVDSLIGGIHRSTSISSMGPSTSSNINDPRLYGMIMHYATSLPQILKDSEHWVAFITRNEEITRSVKQDLNWPKTITEMEEEREEQEKFKEVVCVRCGDSFTEAENKSKDCIYHNGEVFEKTAYPSLWKLCEVEKAKVELLTKSVVQTRSGQNNNGEPQFVHICCLDPLRSQGCQKKKHTAKEVVWKEEKLWKKKNEYLKKFESLQREVKAKIGEIEENGDVIGEEFID